MPDDRLKEFAPLFYPGSHAVIGASANNKKFGGKFLSALLNFGYKGKLFPVNPQEKEVLGLKAYASVRDIPGSVDLASIAVPARAVPDVLEECLSKGIKAAQILSAGFSEVGDEGKELEERIKKTAAKGIRVIGPNCFGVYCPKGGLTILPGDYLPRESGPVAFISQSGGYAIRVPRRAEGWGIKYSKVISYGNACDINECDLLEYLYHDPDTKIITAYIEGVKDGARFFNLLREITKKKPVILWKGGLTRGGARAAHSHTASLGGNETVWEAVFTQTGAICVNNLEELLDTTQAFLHLPPIKRRNVCVVGGGGGIGVAAADACERESLTLPLFSNDLQKKLASLVPPAGASVRNPVDVASPFPPAPMLTGVLESVVTGADIDVLMVDEIEMYHVIRKGQDLPFGDEILKDVAQVPVDIRDKYQKPVVIVLPVEAISSDMLESEGARRKVRDYYFEQDIPVYLTLERAVKALSRFIGYYERKETVVPVI